MQIFWARLASFCHLGQISYPLIVSKFHNKTHDPKGQEYKSLNTFFYICRTISKMAKNGQRLSVSTTSLFYQNSFKFHVWIASIKLSLKFNYEFCWTKVNQDGRWSGRHILVCAYRHSTLVIYYLITAKFHIYISITKMAAKWPPPVSLH